MAYVNDKNVIYSSIQDSNGEPFTRNPGVLRLSNIVSMKLITQYHLLYKVVYSTLIKIQIYCARYWDSPGIGMLGYQIITVARSVLGSPYLN